MLNLKLHNIMKDNEMMTSMVELERAINKAWNTAQRKFENAGFSHEWYSIMKCLEAMTAIKCSIDILPE